MINKYVSEDVSSKTNSKDKSKEPKKSTVNISKYDAENKIPKKALNDDKLLPVSLLCGFLGAGKTTLLKHVLETKHAEEGFKCAVIVNDMAALNIDKDLIDKSALVQSDEVIAMQNGCFCCTLQNDLVEQIITLAQKNMFNYMLIEASGVSEPSQIAPLFELCDDEHDHEAEHKEGPQLGEVARLDTCVTVVDAAEFYNNLGSMKTYEEGDVQGTIAELMMEQVEYSNVVVLNKQDLVDKEQQNDILERIAVLNPKAKVIKSTQSKIKVKEILNTRLFNRADVEENSVMIAATKAEASKDVVEPDPECCIVSLDNGGKKCCKSKAKNGQTVDSGLSQVLLGVLKNNNASNATRHEKRFGISSFVYRARRPFHPVRLHEKLLEPYFMEHSEPDGAETRSFMTKIQKQAHVKQKKRNELMGDLLRSKGFIWLATANSIMGGLQQAGNILRIQGEGHWMIECKETWEGTISEELILKDMTAEDGKVYPFGDRRQELVFIGIKLDHRAIQNALDKCLLTDEEMDLGPEKWAEVWMEEDKIQLSLEDSDDEEEDGEEEDEEGDDEEGDGEEGEEEDEKEDDLKPNDEGPPAKKAKSK